MKTGTKIAILVGILLLAFGLTMMQIAHHRGESFRDGMPMLSFNTSGSFDYDQKGYTVCTDGEERFSSAEVDSLRIDWLTGSVSVERYDGREVVVREKAYRKLGEDERLRFRLSGGTLSILPCANKVRNLPEKDLTVLVPQGLTLRSAEADATSASVTLRGLGIDGRLHADALSGSLHVEDCVCGELRLGSSSGSQHVFGTEVSGRFEASMLSGSFAAQDLRCGELDIDSSSGGQRIEGLRCGDLSLSSLSGSLRAKELECRDVKAEASSGSVELAFAEAPRSVDVESSSGSVTLVLPRDTGIDLDYDSGSGDLHGKVVYGSLPVEVDTSSGDLTIEYR